MKGEPLQTESPNPALGKENGDVGCAMGIVGERFSGEGTWNREARRVTLLAAELGVVLDREMLILCDVRELMALRFGLQRALAREARRPWAILRPTPAMAALRLRRCGAIISRAALLSLKGPWTTAQIMLSKSSRRGRVWLAACTTRLRPLLPDDVLVGGNKASVRKEKRV